MGLVGAVAAVLVIGSLAEVHAQSVGIRSYTTRGYGALATRVVNASTLTGSRLATLIDQAPQLPNGALPGASRIPVSARARIQQGLDEAVRTSAAQADQAAHLVPPEPNGPVGEGLAAVLSEREHAVSALRSAIDELLGMDPLPTAGAPVAPRAAAPAPLISIGQASAAMAAAGSLIEQADDRYRSLAAEARRQRPGIRLPRSVWAPAPTGAAALGSARLGATAPLLAGSAALVPFHQLVITAVGLSPPAIASGGPGVVGDGCNAPASAVPGPAPTVLPPTGTVRVALTLTNCGTVTEPQAVVSQSLTPADPAGSAPAPPGARGGRGQVKVTVRSGASVALSFPALAVAGGHRYLLDLAVAVPPDQYDPAGTTQQFLLQIAPA
jgi:hypothetical protein